MNHLPLMDTFSVKIEELQRDILFKKMGNVDLFSWDEIKTNKSNKFKDYLNLTMSHYQMKTSSLDHIKPNTLFAAKSMTANGVTV
jgi:hypothetical protein